MSQPVAHHGMQRTRPHRVLRASAGSGKTFQLSNRYILLLLGGARPSDILAVTFTRKAAGEVLGRVLLRLSRAAVDEASAARLAAQLGDPPFAIEPLTLTRARDLLTQLCAQLHRVQVCTIDAFLHRMVGCLRLELGFTGPITITSDESAIARVLRRQAIEQVLATEDDRFLLDLLRRTQHGQAARSVTETLMSQTLRLYRDFELTPPTAWQTVARRDACVLPLPDEANIAREQLDSVQPILDQNPKSWGKAGLEDLQRFLSRDWMKFLATGLPKKFLLGDHYYIVKREPLPEVVVEAYQPLIDHAIADMLHEVLDSTAATRDLLIRYYLEDQRLLREQAVVRFADLTGLLRRAMRGHGFIDDPRDPEVVAASVQSLYFRLDQRVRHLLLDEFQDTSPAQWQVLRPLAEQVVAGSSEGVDEFESLGPPRSLFCVGDVKQSIYGWREGCPQVFDDVIDGLSLHGCVGSLSTSYRSSPVVLDAVDRVFTRLPETLERVAQSLATPDKPSDRADKWQPVIAAAREWCAGYEPHRSHDPSLAGYVELRTSDRPEELDDQTPDNPSEDDDDTHNLAGSSDPTREAGSGDGEPMHVAGSHLEWVVDRLVMLRGQHPGASIGVLCRSNKCCSAIVRGLRRKGLAASGEGGTALRADPAVVAVLNTLKLAEHPGDSASAFAVQHSPLGAAMELTDAGSPAQRQRASLRLRRGLLDRGYAGMVARLSAVLRPVCNADSMDRLDDLLALAEDYDARASLRIDDFLRHAELAQVELPGRSSVRVMTLHKSKGLEFDLAVLPELEAAGSRLIGTLSARDRQLLRYREHEFDAPSAVFRSIDQKRIAAITAHVPEALHLRLAYEQEQRRTVRDALSTLYVGMTRARQGLYLWVQPARLDKHGQPRDDAVHARHHAAILRQTLCDSPDPGDIGLLWSHGRERFAFHTPPASDTKTSAEPRLAFSQDATRFRPVRTPSTLGQSQGLRAADLLRADDRAELANTGVAFGSALHDWLATVEYADAVQDGDVPERFRAAWSHAALREAMSPRFERERLWREKSFVQDDGQGGLIRGSFDRVVLGLDAQGKVTQAHLIDFKSDAVRDEPDAIAARVEHHRPQMSAYRQALSVLLGLPPAGISAELVFTSPGRRAPLA